MATHEDSSSAAVSPSAPTEAPVPNAGSGPVLSVVMPVYNEGAAVEAVLRDWTSELQGLDIDYEIRVYDDGSSDDTGEVLERAAGELPRLKVYRQTNRGHGPTILRSYREARGAWIFQTDSDGEMDVAGFRRLWRERDGYDFLLGVRQGRTSSPLRRVVTGVSRLTIRALFGRGVRDVNTPFRLMRRDCLRRLLPLVPEDAFAPNIILSGLAVRAGLRIFEAPVRFIGRRHGGGSLGSFKIVGPAIRSFRQTVAAGRRSRRGSTP